MEDQKIIPNTVPLPDHVGVDLSKFLPDRMPKNKSDQTKLARIMKKFESRQSVSPETIREARRLGMPRPDYIAEWEWNAAVEKDVNYQKKLATYMLAWGMAVKEVAASVGISSQTILEWKRNEVFSDEIKALQMEIFGRDPMKAIKNLIPAAIGRVAETMNDGAVKPQTRLSAAQDILDRGLGKAVQKTIIEETSLRKVIENLDAIRRNGSLEDILDADFSEVDPKDKSKVSIEKEIQKEELDAADQWLKENP